MSVKDIVNRYLSSLENPQNTFIIDPKNEGAGEHIPRELQVVKEAAENLVDGRQGFLHYREPTKYALVSRKDAVARGLIARAYNVDSGSTVERIHNTSANLHDDCLQIRGYITATGMYCNSGSMCTTPIVLLVRPYLNGDVIVPGFAVTNSGSVYRLVTLPAPFDEVAKDYPCILEP